MTTRQTLTIFEDRYTTVKLSSEQTKELIGLEHIWGRQHLLLHADGRLLMRKYVGFIATPSLQIQILPKVFAESGEKSEEEKKQAISMLFRLLQYSGFTAVKEIPDPQTISRFDADILEIYIHLFIKKFLVQFNRNVYRNYEERIENRQFIKGKILFQESIIRNKGFQHQHVVRFDEFTEDTLLNQIFKSIILLLLKRSTNPENKKRLKIALVYLEDVSEIRLSSSTFKRIKFNRLNESYLPLFNMAKMFYYNAIPGLSQGDERTLTFLVPLNKLFEYTVYQLLLQNLPSDKFSVNYQKPEKFLDDENDKFTLKPDITVNRRGDTDSTLLIVDPKYKNPEYKSQVQAAQSDIYQMLAYAVRYRCDKVCLVYPEFLRDTKLKNPLAEYCVNVDGRSVSIKMIQVDLFEEDMAIVGKRLIDDLGSINSGIMSS